MSQHRETLASRLGFIFLSAGCAIGLGNRPANYGNGIFHRKGVPAEYRQGI